jgi:hypothetical protein
MTAGCSSRTHTCICRRSACRREAMWRPAGPIRSPSYNWPPHTAGFEARRIHPLQLSPATWSYWMARVPGSRRPHAVTARI